MARADKNSITEYLLGRLTEAEEEQVELRLLTDPDFAEEYDIVVNEITDEYLAGKFEGEELNQVENYFFKSPERRSKLKFALALKQRKSEIPSYEERKRIADVDDDRSGPAPIPWWHPQAFKSYRPYLAIAATVVLVIGGFYIWFTLSDQSDLNKGLVALRTAFKDERPIEPRLADFNYAPLPNQRGEPAKVDYVQRDLAASLLLKEVNEHPNAASHHALGQYYLANRDLDKAIDQLKQAVGLDANNARVHSDLGAALLEKGRAQASGPDKGKELEAFGQSLEHLRKALEIDSSLLEAQFNRALLFQNMMPSQQAAEVWRQYLQRDANSPWAEEARRNLKLLEDNSHRTSWNTSEAIKDFQEASRAGDENAAWNVVSQAYTSAGNEVSNRLLNWMVAADPVGEPMNSAAALEALAHVGTLESDKADDRFTSDLVAYYKRASPELLPLLTEGRKRMNAAYALFTQSRFKDAIDEYASAKAAFERAGDRVTTVFIDYRQAHCNVLLPDLETAEAAFKRLLAECEMRGYRWLAAQCLYGLAHINAARNEYSKALDYSGQTLAVFEEIGDRNGVLKCMSQLADLNQSLNRSDRSMSYLSRGLALTGEIRAEPMQRWGLFVQIAFSMSAKQLHPAALLYHKAALATALEMSRPLLISRSHGFVGSTYAAMKMYPEAVGEANKAIETGKTVSASGGVEIVANASLRLADIRRQASECDKAIDAYDKSLELYSSLNLGYYSYAAHKGKLMCLVSGSDEQLAREELRTVMGLSESYRSKITSESERISFFALQQSVYDLAIHFEFVRMHNQTRAFEYSEESHARSLLDVVRRTGEVLKRSHGPDLKLPAVTKPRSLFEVQEKMPADAQILQYAVLEDRLLMWIVTKSGLHHREVPISSQALTQKVRKYLSQVTAPPTDGAGGRDLSDELYRILIEPVEPLLDESKFLCLVPDKILHFVPYQALLSPTTSLYLMDDFDIGIAPSSSLFADLSEAFRQKDLPRDEKILSVGNPEFDRAAFSPLSYLPSAGREAQTVAALYPKRRVLSGLAASETNIRAEIGSSEIAHFAMHYVVNQKAEMLSGFPLAVEPSPQNHENSNSFLQAYEIYTMNFPRTRLVVLSGCQTGIEREYRGEGAVGLARTFLARGVPIVIASLWPVDSEATAQLMVAFHKNRVQHNLDAMKALKRAQVEMAHGADLRYRHPYYWAPFVAIGARSTPPQPKK